MATKKKPNNVVIKSDILPKEKRKNPPLYIIFQVGPIGFDDAHIEFTDKPYEEGIEYTHGEGQALIFEMKNWDMSPNFHRAYENGELLKLLQHKWHKVIIDRGQ